MLNVYKVRCEYLKLKLTNIDYINLEFIIFWGVTEVLNSDVAAFFVFIEIQLIYNVMLVSGVPHSGLFAYIVKWSP